jgi:predicted nucleotidyltransferase
MRGLTPTRVYGYRLSPETHERLKAIRVAYETLSVYEGECGRVTHESCIQWMLERCEFELRDRARRLGVDLDALARMTGRA